MKKGARLLGAAVAGAFATGVAAVASTDRGAALASSAFNVLVSERGVAVEQGLVYGPLARHRLDVYRPGPGVAPKAVVIFYYGGAWRMGERGMYRFVGAALASHGFVAVIPDYRLYPETLFPGFMEDAALAYRFVQDRLNPEGAPVALMGHSAGAHIAALLALDPARLEGAARPIAVVGLAGPYAFDPTTWPSTRAIFAPAAGHPDQARPVAFASRSAPPMFLARGADDDVVAPYNADDLARALRDHGVAVENVLYPGLGHTALILAFARPFRWRAPALADSVAFIEKALKAPR